MPGNTHLDRLILEKVQSLPAREKKEVIAFIDFLMVREDHSFIDYVNRKTKQAIEAKQRGEKFTSLQELQREYG